MMYCSQMCRWNTYADGCTKPFDAICPLSNMNSKDKLAPTNADHIRSMTDEELAQILGCSNGFCWSTSHYALEWLKQPYKEDT